ncbi:MAG: hypothetical protein ACF8MJ_08410 [Phycisphaerales bacterium JB050]
MHTGWRKEFLKRAIGLGMGHVRNGEEHPPLLNPHAGHNPKQQDQNRHQTMAFAEPGHPFIVPDCYPPFVHHLEWKGLSAHGDP